MRLHLLEHDPIDLSRTYITMWAKNKGHQVTHTYLCNDEELPAIDDFDWLMVMGAFAQALPGKIMAPGFDGLWDTHIAGQRLDGRQFSYTWFSAGGTGALKGQDGLSATAYPSGIAGVPVEVIETLAPLVIHNRELRTDSGGPGTFRGGLGQSMQIEVLTDKPYIFSGLYERTKFPAPGLQELSCASMGAIPCID